MVGQSVGGQATRGERENDFNVKNIRWSLYTGKKIFPKG